MNESDNHSARDHADGLRSGTVLWGRYQAEAELGESVLGQVWLCRDTQADGAPVVLRWLPPDVRRSRALLSVLHENIRKLSESDHPNVAPVRQMVYAGAEIYLVGDYAPGATLAEWAEGLEADRDGKRPTLDELLPVLAQAAAALDFVHGQGAAHGNLTPTNVFVDEDGAVRVTDFGLAFGRHTSMRRGEDTDGGAAEAEALAVAFRAPEQRTGGDADSAADQYSLAALACWTMTGRATPADSDWADWPPKARAAFRRALNPKPGKRFVTCGDFVRALRGERVGGRRKGSAEARRKVLRIAGIAAGVVALVALGAGAVLGIAKVLNGRSVVDAVMAERPEVTETPVTYAARNTQPVKPLVAETPLPVEGKPWVASTVPMEFVWVFEMQMWIGRFEVTNEEYLEMNPNHESGRFVSPKGSMAVSLEGKNHPVVGVNFAEAYRYARWLTEREREAGKLPDGWAYRLPSAAEAEAYIRAGSNAEYPWGDALPPVRGNYADDTLAAVFSDMPVIEGYRDGAICTAEVQESGENAWGLFGANGNVWETASREPGDSHFGGWFGGAWDDWQPNRLRADARYGFRGDAHGMVNGFRLVLAPAVAAQE